MKTAAPNPKKTHEQISVFVADDHPFILDAMVREVARLGFRVAGSADSFARAKAGIKREKPDVIIYGLDGPGTAKGQGGFAWATELLRSHKGARIIVFTPTDSMPIISMAYKAGAKAVLNIRMKSDVVGAAIKAVAQDRVFYMPGVAEKLAAMYTGSESANPRDVLTARQLELFTMLASGMPPSKVAAKLKLKPITISNQAVNIRNKLNCSRGDFQRIALHFRLID